MMEICYEFIKIAMTSHKNLPKVYKIYSLVKNYGFIKFTLMTVDTILYFIIRLIRESFYRWKDPEFGILEALFWSKDIDPYLRYSKIINELKNIKTEPNRKIRVLEVGAGGEGISKFLKYAGDYKKYDIYLADIDLAALSKVKLGTPVIIEGTALPFENNKFDAVISIDTLEHIPKSERHKFVDELKRVSNNTVLLHFIMHDPDRQFLGSDADLKFNKWFLKNFKKEHSWTAEHLRIESPCCSEIQGLLPGALITGTQNTEIWFKYTTLRLTPLLGFLTGLVYILKWKEKDNTAPFHGCIVKWTKQ
jgi:SAM-dependent methyltransferase